MTSQLAAASLKRGCRKTTVAAGISWLGIFKKQQDVKLESKITLLWASVAKPPSCLSAQAPPCSLPDAMSTLRKTQHLQTSRHDLTPATQESVKDGEGAGGGVS